MRSRIIALAAVLAATTTAAVAGPSSEAAPTSAADPIVLPDIIDEETLGCTQLVPHAISVDNIAVSLELRILLDGVTRAVADEAVADLRKAYGPLGITVAASYEAVSFTGTDAVQINQQAKDLYGGQRPEGVDVVYTMTDKDLTLSGSPLGDDVAGLADCIGGVRYDDRAFAVGETFPDPTTGGLVPLPVRDATGKTMAHEVGHLLGGHHHYSSPEGLLASDPSALSLMGPTLSLISLKFSTLNTLMVKAHAQLYCAP